ncbi:MAG: OmpA family protein [Desulfobacteraceae bacterium]|nr:OmpA family protein [Desulfobacteraceae bacterium]
MEGQKLTIIKKVKKGGGAGHHGGSWKVAFADFMTAMMAFFLLMWLLSMGPQKKKEDLANYFKTFSLFGEGGVSSSSVSLSDDAAGGKTQVNPGPSSPSGDSGGDQDGDAEHKEMEAMKSKIQTDIKSRLAEVKDQVVINEFEGGIKVDIMDKNGQPMFKLGSTELTDKAKQVLAVVAADIKDSTRRIEIEGHTDAVAYSSNQKFGNWELSTARASAARVELERDGLNPALLVRVSGYAATEPIIKDNPFDPRNRRISIRILYPQKPAPGGPQAGGTGPDAKQSGPGQAPPPIIALPAPPPTQVAPQLVK